MSPAPLLGATHPPCPASLCAPPPGQWCFCLDQKHSKVGGASLSWSSTGLGQDGAELVPECPLTLSPCCPHHSSLPRALRLGNDSGRGSLIFQVTHVFCLCGIRQAPLAPLPLGSSLALGLNLVLGLGLDVAQYLALVQVLGSPVPTGKTIQLREPGLEHSDLTAFSISEPG